MQKTIKYAIFKTKWGYFGLAGNKFGLLRTCLPLNNTEKVKSQLLKDVRVSSIKSDKDLFKTLQEQIIAYFDGTYINFSPAIPIMLSGQSCFTRSVLTACRKIRFGQVLTYRELARKIRKTKAVRAVGNALAKNPLPLIIPCHRIIRSDGHTGGFSAPGGRTLKIKLLKHEQDVLFILRSSSAT